MSSFSDIGFQIITSKFNGVPALKTVLRSLKTFSTNNLEDMQIAATIGLGGDAFIETARVAHRFADTYGVGTGAKAANVVLRASLLTWWTNSFRTVFGLEFSSALGFRFQKHLTS